MRSEKDFEVRKAKAWGECHQLKKIWQSDMRREMKIRLFRATVESVLFYGSETWTISQSMSKRINGYYNRMLRMALNIKWSDRVSNVDVFDTIPKPRLDDILAHHVLFWEPRHGRRGPRRPRLTFLNPGHAKGGHVHQGPSYTAARKSSLLCSNDKCGGGTQQLEPMNRPKSVHYNNLLPVD